MDFAFVGTSEGADWDDWDLRNLTGDEGVLTLGSHGTNVGSAELPALAEADLTIRAFDTDDCGVLYLLTGERDLYRYHHAEDRLTHLCCVADADSEARYEPVDLAVTRDDIVIAEALADPDAGGDPDPTSAGGGSATADPPGRLHALSKHLLQTRWLATEGVGTPIRLLDDDRRVLLLTDRVVPDTAPPETTGVLARLVGGGVGPTIRTGLRAPRDAALAGDRLVVLTDAGSVAVTTEGDDVPDWLPPTVRRDGQVVPSRCLTADADSLVVGLAVGETLVRFTPAFTDSEAGGGAGGGGTESRTVETVPGFRHPTARLLARRHEPRGVYVLDETGTLRFSAAIRRFTADPETGRYTGTARRWFDSGERGVAWHRTRLSLSADDPGTGVTVRYCATDDPPMAAQSSQSAQHSTEYDWQTARDPADALLDDAEGRYLGVELELVGTDATSPRVSSLRASLPRQSYLRYLPAIYDTEREDRSFLERYLSIFESAFVDVEAGIESIPRMLDPGGVPAEFVGWLGSWLASETDSAWPTAARREFLARAPELYRLRGTPAGLVETVRIYLRHAETDVPDWFRERPGAAMTTGGAGPSTPGGAAGSAGSTGPAGSGGPSASTATPASTASTASSGTSASTASTGPAGSGGPTGASDPAGSGGAPDSSPDTGGPDGDEPTADADLPVYLWEFASFDCIDDPEVLCDWRRLVECPQCFLLLVPPGVGSEAMAAIDRIVAWATPAHAVGQAVELRPWLRLGANGYLGVNSYLGDRAFVVEDALLGADSVLGGREPDGQLGLAGRLDREARLS
jgi:phage tail-like protein